jgi:SAM-dependent methyltransferase
MKKPKQKPAHSYDNRLRLPFIRSIRAAENSVISKVFHERVHPLDSVLEIGAGTGYYTLKFARGAGRLTAVDSSAEMVKHLKREVQKGGFDNVKVVAADFLKYSDDMTYDWVMALGVLEYQQNPSAFLGRMIAFSHKWVLVTFPTPGVWGKIYRAASRLKGVRINLFTRSEIEKRFGASIVHIEDVGLKSRLAGGMTLVCLIERNMR